MLPRYRFQISDSEEKPSTGGGKMVLLAMNVGELADERVLSRCAMLYASLQMMMELKFMACHAIISFMKYASRNGLRSIPRAPSQVQCLKGKQ
ncbi:hypothetical protein C5167_012705 [Papaver somniferum]|uniref:Uncharacterized protein n=2 Tax=Papaver somniferum TaxID=3469 RepID=A0A4Y7J1M9_PAPSO|nr:hypothetical protein C5167_012705 [Papaver somniferum]